MSQRKTKGKKSERERESEIAGGHEIFSRQYICQPSI